MAKNEAKQVVSREVLLSGIKSLEGDAALLRENARSADRELAVARLGHVPQPEIDSLVVKVRQAKSRARVAANQLALLKEALAASPAA